jgi:glycosyltransferase involved in cell wall biosynthesis
MKVLHLPTSVAGQAFALCEAERELGIDSDCLVAFRDTYYPEMPSLFDNTPSSPIDAIRYIPKILSGIRRIRTDYDILHFNFSRSLLDYPGFLNLADIGFYRKQKIFVTFNGCDARLRNNGLPYSPCDSNDCRNRVCWPGSNSMKLSRVAKWRSVAEKMFVSTPDLIASIPDAMFVPNTVCGFGALEPAETKVQTDCFTIVHAPTNRHIKGTEYVQQSVANLRRLYPVRLITVENKPRAESLAIYKTADIAIDQLRLGWYGVFAAECMAMGVPTISYYRDEECGLIPPDMHRELSHSLINATPDSVSEALLYFIDNPAELQRYRQNGIAFANRWHSPQHVASLLKKEYDAVM